MELVTDLIPGFEFQVLEIDLGRERPTLGGDLAAVDRLRVAYFDPRSELFRGVSVGEFTGLSNGLWWVTATFYGGNGDRVARQVLAVQVQGDTAITILYTRDCVDVECPATGGDPSLLACLRGECVDPRCPQDRTYCPPEECSSDADCDSFDGFAVAECVEMVCSEAFCFAAGRDGACAAAETCHPAVGCGDFGSGGGDAGVADAGDAGVADDAGSECRPFACNTSNECAVGATSCSTGLCEPIGNAVDGTRCSAGRCEAGSCIPFEPTMGLLTVEISPADGGTVASRDGRIACPDDCDEAYPLTAVVELTASANPGFVFVGWEGDLCEPIDSPTCNVNVMEATLVRAVFMPDVSIFEVVLQPPMGGRVDVTIDAAPQTPCTVHCNYPYTVGAAFSLRAVPAPGFTFTRWDGLCREQLTSVCTLPMTPADGVALAVFEP